MLDKLPHWEMTNPYSLILQAPGFDWVPLYQLVEVTDVDFLHYGLTLYNDKQVTLIAIFMDWKGETNAHNDLRIKELMKTIPSPLRDQQQNSD